MLRICNQADSLEMSRHEELYGCVYVYRWGTLCVNGEHILKLHTYPAMHTINEIQKRNCLTHKVNPKRLPTSSLFVRQKMQNWCQTTQVNTLLHCILQMDVPTDRIGLSLSDACFCSQAHAGDVHVSIFLSLSLPEMPCSLHLESIVSIDAFWSFSGICFGRFGISLCPWSVGPFCYISSSMNTNSNPLVFLYMLHLIKDYQHHMHAWISWAHSQIRVVSSVYTLYA